MANPPVPPRPFDNYDDYVRRKSHESPPPQVPPLPPGFRIVEEDPDVASPPHFEDPLVAPRPHRLQPDLPANMARTLDEQLSQPPDPYRSRSPQPPYGAAPAFPVAYRDPSRGPSPLPPPQGSEWSPWAGTGHPPGALPPHPKYRQPRAEDSLPNSFARLSVSEQPRQHRHTGSNASMSSTYGLPPNSPPQRYGPPPQQPANTTGPPMLTAALPTVASLAAHLNSVQQPGFNPAGQIAWIRDVLSLVERSQQQVSSTSIGSSTDPTVGPIRIGDPELQRLVNVAVPLLLQISAQQQQTPLPPHVVEAIYLRATCEATGAYPQFVPHNPRTAFRNFERAAKAGFYAAWFKLGRDYENFGDMGHAKDCFERGVKFGVVSCLYRMGMAHLMGQLGLPANAEAALPLLVRAAENATIEAPQPAYVYGLLLQNEFTHISIPPALFGPHIPPGSSLQIEARKHLERAAYLNFAPAQYKLGHAYEFAIPPFPFDALLSVQYYSLASQQGEIEADMALSKWFLCGADGAFEKDEALAFTFAEKAARKGLPSAEFAMGYYAEVGVGGPKDIDAAQKWYTKAAQHGNTDAAERLQALSQPAPQALSREEHENITDSRLVRKRTLAKQRSEATPGVQRASMTAGQGQQILDDVKRTSLTSVPAVAAPQGRLPAVTEERIVTPPSNSMSPRPSTSGPPSQGAQSRPFAGAPRYSLADPGVGSNPPSNSSSPKPGLPGSPALMSAREKLRQQTQQQNRPNGAPGSASYPEAPEEDAPPTRPPPGRGPKTFEEMGFTSQKLEEKDCVIM
ncbi:hypothetical protein OBBRIDRAFT_760449 [Obba rivulosa]|uniref:HCP-like protein n=1 Tax=Obba rivulosa TaxID=1052685 RepID=A0A8E2AS55_9APHY|nr:hypothetical protein OBBRIDRAFT_760449 [Obba rivulosa]